MTSQKKYQKLLSEERGPRPPCFTEEQWTQWWRAVRDITPELAPVYGSYCEHCEAEWQRENLAAGTCRHPETEFKLYFGLDRGVREVGYDPAE